MADRLIIAVNGYDAPAEVFSGPFERLRQRQ